MSKLFMLLIGCTPPGRHIEQHDIYFGIGENIRDLIPGLLNFWPEAKNKIHIDAWREVTQVNGHAVTIVPAKDNDRVSAAKLFFINLGGYKQQEFEEFHYKMIIAAGSKAEAISRAKDTAFFRHTGFQEANSHIDDKYGVDVDDLYEIKDILPKEIKNEFSIIINPGESASEEDEIHLGYFKLNSFH